MKIGHPDCFYCGGGGCAVVVLGYRVVRIEVFWRVHDGSAHKKGFYLDLIAVDR